MSYEFRAKEIDDNQEQENIAEQRSIEKEHQSEEAQDSENKYDKALEKPVEEEQDGAQVIQPSCYSNVSHKVHLADNLLALQFGQNNIFDASISKFLISYERPIRKSNLFVSNMIIPKHIGHHVVPFRETNGDRLLQPKISQLFHLNCISTWVTLLISYLAYIWSQVIHLCYNYFDFTNLKPRSKSFDNADADRKSVV